MPFFELIFRIFQGVVALVGIFSPKHRKQLLDRWSKQSTITNIGEAFGALIGIVVIIGLIVLMARRWG